MAYDIWQGSEIYKNPYKANWFAQFRAVLWRSWLNITKETVFVKVRIIQTTVRRFDFDKNKRFGRFVCFIKLILFIHSFILDGSCNDKRVVFWPRNQPGRNYEHKWSNIYVLNKHDVSKCFCSN